MTLPRTVADVLNDHVVFEVECIDWMYLGRVRAGAGTRPGWSGSCTGQLGLPIASTALLGKISDGFSDAMRHFARDQHVGARGSGDSPRFG